MLRRPLEPKLDSLIRVMNRLGRGYSFEALRAKILFTEDIHGRRQARPKLERKRAPEPIGRGSASPDEVAGDGLPATRPPKEANQHKKRPAPRNHGAYIPALIRMIEAGKL